LDLGTGHGRSARVLAESCGRHVIGVDIDLEKLFDARARLVGEPLDFVRGEAARLPFRGESFALVTAIFTIHEIERSSVLLALREVRRVLKPEGGLIVVDKCRVPALTLPEELTLLTEEAFHSALEQARGARVTGVMAPDDLVELVESAGFEVEERWVGRVGKWLPPEEFLKSWGAKTKSLIQQIEDQDAADRLRKLVDRIVEIAKEHGYGPAPALCARFSKT